ncbi:MAG: sulfurtransferase [Solirubrobacteraceae bacterium]|jgi:thiosulfate/3-mercaptopyruvate sulfurtransferase
MSSTEFGPLISADALAGLLRGVSASPTLLDIRWELATGVDRDGYLAGHLPGAVLIDLDRQLSAAPGQGGRHPLPHASAFTTAMRSAGVCAERPVVVYDAATSLAAGRAWWLLRYFGHPLVAVLDGGLAAWRVGGRPLETDVPSTPTGDFVARPGGMPVLDADYAAEIAAQGVLLDARAPERYAGTSEGVDPVAGHIPGALNRPTAQNVAPDGRFLDPRRLRSAFTALGVRDDIPVGTYCGSGVTAAHQVLALELAGYRAALYPGSWSEWITDATRPIASANRPPTQS